ncbi:MAG TPA: hypothetical protein VJM53_04980 [Burkholderiales bacterium]|nr:hypothetical protein [Burkholderiales bacterium]
MIVALFGLAGTLGAALIANWDKIFGKPTPPQETVQPAEAPRLETPREPPDRVGDRTTDRKIATRTAQDTADTEKDSADVSESEPLPPPARSTRAQKMLPITGMWRDLTYPGIQTHFEQSGDQFEFVRFGTLPDGLAFRTQGAGRLNGVEVESRYTAQYANGSYSQGVCAGAVSAQGRQMELQCNDSLLGTFPLRLQR